MTRTPAFSDQAEAPVRVAVEHLDAPQHPDACRFHRYYLDLAAQGRLPARADFPVRALAPLMPGLFIIAPAGPAHAPDSDWRFRLIGTAITERLGLDATGMAISQLLSPDQLAHHAGVYTDVAHGRRLSITRGCFEGLDREYVQVEIVHVPMAAPDGVSRWVLGLMAFTDS